LTTTLTRAKEEEEKKKAEEGKKGEKLKAMLARGRGTMG